MLKLTPIRLDDGDTKWIDRHVKRPETTLETRSNFIRVAIREKIQKEKKKYGSA